MAKQSIINEGIVDSESPMSNINVTSLVDVMFCLLIMFMVATPLIKQEGADVDLPPSRGEELGEDAALYSIVSIDAEGNHFLGGMALSKDPDKLKAEITGNAKLKEDGMLFLQADKNLDHAKIVDLLILLREAEVTEVGFVVDPDTKKIKAARGQ